MNIQTSTIICPRGNINTDIYGMRQSGATLQQIANKIGRTKERVRQILVKNYGSTKRELISTEQLCKTSGFCRYSVGKLCQDSLITPVRNWNTGSGQYLLWSPATVEQIEVYFKTQKLCRMCNHPILNGRRVWCSEQCFKESRKYKYKSAEAKRRHLSSIKRYRERRKQLLFNLHQ